MKFPFLSRLPKFPPIWPFSSIIGSNVPLPRPRDYELSEEEPILPPGETRIVSPPGDDCWLK